MTALEVAAEAYRKAQLEFEAADAVEGLLMTQLGEMWTRLEREHPEWNELSRRHQAAHAARRDAANAGLKAAHALQEAARTP